MARAALGEIQRKINESDFIRVMMNDTSDCSNFISKGEVEGHLLGLVNASGNQSVDCLHNILLNELATTDKNRQIQTNLAIL